MSHRPQLSLIILINHNGSQILSVYKKALRTKRCQDSILGYVCNDDHRAYFNTTTGLDAAGKTTILYRLKLGEIVTTIPTIGNIDGK